MISSLIILSLNLWPDKTQGRSGCPPSSAPSTPTRPSSTSATPVRLDPFRIVHAPPVPGVHPHPSKIAQIHGFNAHPRGDIRPNGEDQSLDIDPAAGRAEKIFMHSRSECMQKRFYRISADTHQEALKRTEEAR